MSKEKIYIFDTTLRDGAQTEGVNFSLDDKNKIAKALSDLGVDYLEGGWPGANTLDTTFFNNPPKLNNTIFTAFSMTKKTGRSAENDPGLSALINSKASAICLVGKSWDFHAFQSFYTLFIKKCVFLTFSEKSDFGINFAETQKIK